MSYCNLTYTAPPGSGTPLYHVEFLNVRPGVITNVISLRIQNTGAAPAKNLTSCRLFAKCASGGYDGSEEAGKEMTDERWLEARISGVGAYQPIGGMHGGGAPTANYLAIPDLAPGDYVDIDLRLNVPVGAATAHTAAVSFGVAYRSAVA